MVPVDSGLAALMIWTAAAFGLGFAAGWFAKRRTVHRKAKRVGACLFHLKAKGLAQDVATAGPYKGWEKAG